VDCPLSEVDMRKLDAIVIGAGQSGPSLAVRLANAGRSVALIERRGLGGGGHA
jgi:pyruvate/2-oxoglutarate dehydrogenase complex dihydrolipoamide dehydrogenase (E3) component